MASRKLSSTLRSRAKTARRSIDASNEEMARRMKQHAIKLTSGSIPKKAIAQAHPFARNRESYQAVTAVVRGRSRPNSRKKVRFTSHGGFPLNPINKHSGKLQRSIRIIPIQSGYRLLFTAPYSKFVLRPGGTKTMVDREFWKQMQRYAAYERKRVAAKVRRDLMA